MHASAKWNFTIVPCAMCYLSHIHMMFVWTAQPQTKYQAAFHSFFPKVRSSPKLSYCSVSSLSLLTLTTSLSPWNRHASRVARCESFCPSKYPRHHFTWKASWIYGSAEYDSLLALDLGSPLDELMGGFAQLSGICFSIYPLPSAPPRHTNPWNG